MCVYGRRLSAGSFLMWSGRVREMERWTERETEKMKRGAKDCYHGNGRNS